MRKILLTMLCMALTTFAFSQIGIRGGISVSDLYIDNDEINDKEANIGHVAGLMYRISIPGKPFYIQPELSLSRRGAEYKLSSTQIESKLDYIDIPVLFIWRPLNGFLTFQGGLQFSRLIDVAYEFNTVNLETIVNDNKNDFQQWDTGLVLGIGIVSGDSFTMDLRYYQGFMSIDKQTTIEGFELGDDIKNFALQLTLGYFL